MLEELGTPIAYGRTAEIYAWHSGQVLKLFYDWCSLENIELEAKASRIVHASGLPTPAVGQIIQVKKRYGLEYERVSGSSMFKAFQREPWNIYRYGRRMAELHAMLHERPILVDLPSQRQRLIHDIMNASALTASLRSKVLVELEKLPDGNRLCHGDFSPNNILMTTRGEIVIDWFRASRGNPLADLARTTNLMLGYIGTRQVRRPFLSFGSTFTKQLENTLFQLFCRLFYPSYSRYYFTLRHGGEAEYRRWLPIMAAARLSDNIPELEKMLVSQVERNL